MSNEIIPMSNSASVRLTPITGRLLDLNIGPYANCFGPSSLRELGRKLIAKADEMEGITPKPERVRVGALCAATLTIAKHLRDKGSISNVEAQAIYKSRSLSRRIADLRARGWTIRSNHLRDHTGQRYVRYILVKEAA